jgi:hypothetical protein
MPRCSDMGRTLAALSTPGLWDLQPRLWRTPPGAYQGPMQPIAPFRAPMAGLSQAVAPVGAQSQPLGPPYAPSEMRRTMGPVVKARRDPSRWLAVEGRSTGPGPTRPARRCTEVGGRRGDARGRPQCAPGVGGRRSGRAPWSRSRDPLRSGWTRRLLAAVPRRLRRSPRTSRRHRSGNLLGRQAGLMWAPWTMAVVRCTPTQAGPAHRRRQRPCCATDSGPADPPAPGRAALPS